MVNALTDSFMHARLRRNARGKGTAPCSLDGDNDEWLSQIFNRGLGDQSNSGHALNLKIRTRNTELSCSFSKWDPFRNARARSREVGDADLRDPALVEGGQGLPRSLLCQEGAYQATGKGCRGPLRGRERLAIVLDYGDALPIVFFGHRPVAL